MIKLITRDIGAARARNFLLVSRRAVERGIVFPAAETSRETTPLRLVVVILGARECRKPIWTVQVEQEGEGRRMEPVPRERR